MRLGFILLLINSSFAQDLGRFCFSSPQTLVGAKSEFNKFKLAGEEQLDVDASCFDIMVTKASRLTFWETFLASRHGAVYRPNKSPHTCKIKLEKRSNGNLGANHFSINKKVNWTNQQQNHQAFETSTLQVQSGKEAALTINNTTLQFVCTRRGETYDIEFSYEQTQNLDIYLTINNEFLFLKREVLPKEKIKTSVSIAPGQKCEIASYVKNSRDGNQELSLENIENEREKLTQTEIIYLSVE